MEDPGDLSIYALSCGLSAEFPGITVTVTVIVTNTVTDNIWSQCMVTSMYRLLRNCSQNLVAATRSG